MDASSIVAYFSEYGLVFLFIIVALEYLNLPGFPAGIIMPMAGIWAASSGENFFIVLIVSVMAGLVGSWGLYFLGRSFGVVVLNKYVEKFPKQKGVIDKNVEKLKEKGALWIFISKLLPVVRTIISIPAGVLKMNFIKYTISSAFGVFIWNFLFVGAGYFFGERVMNSIF